MSSTNRGGRREVSDYYKTPPDRIRHFLVEFFDDEIQEHPQFHIDKQVYLDPCAGGDAKHGMSYPDILREWGSGIHIRTVDIRDDSRAEIKGDYLSLSCARQADIIITNPPFSHAIEIIEKALQDVREGGLVIMLLRLNFFGSKGRREFWKKYMPEKVYVFNARISFTGGKTDSIEYAHFVWRKDHYPEFARLKVID